MRQLLRRSLSLRNCKEQRLLKACKTLITLSTGIETCTVIEQVIFQKAITLKCLRLTTQWTLIGLSNFKHQGSTLNDGSLWLSSAI